MAGVTGSATRKPSARARQPRRRAEIIDAAAHVFAAQGYHGATTQDIADRLGIRQASLYYYFPSKEVALEQVCLIGVEGYVEAARHIAQSPDSPGEKLQGLIAAHIMPLQDRAHYTKVFLNERQHLPEACRRRIGRKARALERIFEQVVQEGIAAGAFAAGLDPRLATLAILGMANAVPAWYVREQAQVDDIARAFAALALDGLRRR